MEKGNSWRFNLEWNDHSKGFLTNCFEHQQNHETRSETWCLWRKACRIHRNLKTFSSSSKIRNLKTKTIEQHQRVVDCKQVAVRQHCRLISSCDQSWQCKQEAVNWIGRNIDGSNEAITDCATPSNNFLAKLYQFQMMLSVDNSIIHFTKRKNHKLFTPIFSGIATKAR